MGLWDIAKAVGKSAYNQLEQDAEDKARWEEKYSRLNKEQLRAEYENFKSGRLSRGTIRYAAFRTVCRDRGYLHD